MTLASSYALLLSEQTPDRYNPIRRSKGGTATAHRLAPRIPAGPPVAGWHQIRPDSFGKRDQRRRSSALTLPFRFPVAPDS